MESDPTTLGLCFRKLIVDIQWNNLPTLLHFHDHPHLWE